MRKRHRDFLDTKRKSQKNRIRRLNAFLDKLFLRRFNKFLKKYRDPQDALMWAGLCAINNNSNSSTWQQKSKRISKRHSTTRIYTEREIEAALKMSIIANDRRACDCARRVAIGI